MNCEQKYYKNMPKPNLSKKVKCNLFETGADNKLTDLPGVKNIEVNKIYNTDCVEGMRKISDHSIDLIVTSPPYD